MNLPARARPARLVLWLLLLAPSFTAPRAAAQVPTPVIVYRTEFEFAEGYRTTANLAGQNNWVAAGTGGNGILTNALPGQGQQAYVGFSPPTAPDDYVALFRPLNFTPLESGLPLVRFTVLMNLNDSTTGGRDSFRWSVYNTNATRLLTLDFDNETLGICYQLEAGTNFINTGYTFANGATYRLEVILNFRRNRWSAYLGDTEIVTLQPITTQNTPLTLGDIAAVYFVHNPASPGDNYMVFDDYTVAAEPIANTNPRLQAVAYDRAGPFTFRAFVEPLLRHTLEVSDDLRQWRFLADYTSPDASFDFRDTTAQPGDRARFYRIRSPNP